MNQDLVVTVLPIFGLVLIASAIFLKYRKTHPLPAKPILPIEKPKEIETVKLAKPMPTPDKEINTILKERPASVLHVQSIDFGVWQGIKFGFGFALGVSIFSFLALWVTLPFIIAALGALIKGLLTAHP